MRLWLQLLLGMPRLSCSKQGVLNSYDVLKILISARKRKRYCVIWPGEFEDGKLIYGEEGYADYKVYNIADYDITFIK